MLKSSNYIYQHTMWELKKYCKEQRGIMFKSKKHNSVLWDTKVLIKLIWKLLVQVMPKYTEVDQKEELGYKLQNSLEYTRYDEYRIYDTKISFDTHQKLANITDTWRKQEGKVSEKLVKMRKEINKK